jgi:hypothetical protein
MAKKQIDPLKAKQKRQKIVLGVLGVLFLGLLAFQVPKLMKQLNPPTGPPIVNPGSRPTAAPGTGTPTLAAPTLRGASEGPTAGTTSGSLVSAAGPQVQDGQLDSFSRFASKDPFAQQLSEDDGSTGGSSAGGTTAPAGGSGTEDPAIPDIDGTDPAPGSAIISVNGTLYSVPTETDFPQPTASDPAVVPLFHLVSLTSHSAKISIVGGEYSNGSRTVTLKEGKPVTLMNAADGTRYKLILMPPGTEVPTTGQGSSTSPTTVTLPPATP